MGIVRDRKSLLASPRSVQTAVPPNPRSLATRIVAPSPLKSVVNPPLSPMDIELPKAPVSTPTSPSSVAATSDSEASSTFYGDIGSPYAHTHLEAEELLASLRKQMEEKKKSEQLQFAKSDVFPIADNNRPATLANLISSSRKTIAGKSLKSLLFSIH